MKEKSTTHHSHNHKHDHGAINYNSAFAIGIILNITFVIIEAGYGFFSNSLALLADAGHNLSDVLGLILAWIASWLGSKKPSERFTYGLGHSSILAALANAVFLLLAVGGICWESFNRLLNPEPTSSFIMVAVATVGIFINGMTAWLFRSGRKSDLNIRGAYLHMFADALVSAGVVLAGILMNYTNWLWLDPVVSLGIGIVIVAGTWGLLRDSFILALAAVPEGIEMEKIKQFLSKIEGASGFHDLHVWAMSTKESALTVHLKMPGGHPGDALLNEISNELRSTFKINHSTVQIEVCDTNKSCPLEPDEIV